MHSMYRRLTAAGFSDWLFFDTRRKWFGASIAVVGSSNMNLTYSVQHMFDDIRTLTDLITLARVTTTATLGRTNHGLSVSDYAYIEGAGAPFDGAFAVASIVDQNSFTYTVPNSGLTAGTPGARFAGARVFNHATLAAQTASADGNYSFPCMACRLNITSFTAGYADIIVTQQGA